MKKYIITSLLAMFTSISSGQIVNIPDPIFKNALVNLPSADLDGDGTVDGDADTNDDGEIQLSEAQAVLGLSVREQFANSFEGIQSFTNITFLLCDENLLTSLDLSSNTLLELVNCSDNELASLTLPSSITLEIVGCNDNILSSLDITMLPNLKTLLASNNNIPSLNTNNNPLLEAMDISDNLLSTLDVTPNPNLTILELSTNVLTSIDVSANPNIELLDVSINNLNALDVSSITNLDFLKCWENNIFTLDVSENSLITRLDCWNNNLHNLNIRNGNNSTLERLKCDENFSLQCIQVDDVAYAESQVNDGLWEKDETASFSEACTLGLADMFDAEVSLFPNPAVDVLHVQATYEIYSIEIFTTQGKLLTTSKEKSLDISRLPSGIYLLKVKTEFGVRVTKFIKS